MLGIVLPALVLITLELKRIKDGIEEEIEKRTQQYLKQINKETVNSII